MRTILITGFGPFPGAPRNPTQALATRLATAKRPSLRLIGHVFATRYDAVDRELPALVERHRPDALLMFGLHRRARTLRVETLARNALSDRPDAGGAVPATRRIDTGGDHARMAAPALRLVHAARRAGVEAVLSRDAGNYLCNYLCWRATALVNRKSGPQLAAFIHVPPVAHRPSGWSTLGDAALERAGAAMLGETILCLGPAGKAPRTIATAGTGWASC
jgi:pyroglutamyl-peptidase